MQESVIATFFMPCTIVVTVRAFKPCTVALTARDSQITNAYFTRRNRDFVRGEVQTFYIQMPISGQYTVVTVDAPGVTDGVEIVKIRKRGLARQVVAENLHEPAVKEFIDFAQRFAFNAAILLPGRYQSRNGDFFIDYSNVLLSSDGSTSPTPARIVVNNAIIEVSKLKMLAMTIPMRLAIHFHEYSHLHENEDMHNELEADLNGLSIYLSLGYPRIEAEQTYTATFSQVPSEANGERYMHIQNFIENFEKLNVNFL